MDARARIGQHQRISLPSEGLKARPATRLVHQPFFHWVVLEINDPSTAIDETKLSPGVGDAKWNDAYRKRAVLELKWADTNNNGCSPLLFYCFSILLWLIEVLNRMVLVLSRPHRAYKCLLLNIDHVCTGVQGGALGFQGIPIDIFQVVQTICVQCRLSNTS